MKAFRVFEKAVCGRNSRRTFFNILLIPICTAVMSGCAHDKPLDRDFIAEYQESLSFEGPQKRASDEGTESLQPVSGPEMPPLDVVGDPNAETAVISLSLEDALVRALANSPDIRVVSFDPSIAVEEITKAFADFDITTFGRLDYQDNDSPVNSSSDIGRQDTRVWESGIKQRNAVGSEWSLSYALVRNWDDRVEFFGNRLSTRYEPMMLFQIRQPLWRDGWEQVNLAGVNISRLNYQISLAAFRQKTEEVATQVITAYWILLQAKEDVEIQQHLLDKTDETLQKMYDRKGIDATTLHIKQVESALKSRQATLFQAQKRFTDVQDVLVRFMSDEQLNLLGKFEILPSSSPILTSELPDVSDVLREAMANNPIIKQARLGIKIAKINVEVARNQKMPRLDLVATTRMQGLDRAYGQANERLRQGDYMSYSVGITYEYPLGNRARKAELRKRILERSKSVSILHNISDQVAEQAKERLRQLDTTQSEMKVQSEAAEAADIYLQTLEDTELIRRSLTPEFLLVKLQAQESLANAQRAHIKAIVDFNNALVQLEEAKGMVLQLGQVQTSFPAGRP